MKNVIVLGGAGFVGLDIVKILAETPGVKVTVADRNAKNLEDKTASLGDLIDRRQIDANDFDSLVRLIKEGDLVVNMIGPYYDWAAKIIKASIGAKTNLLDVNDDYDATKECLSLSEKAKDAGITAVTGCGFSPGLTNILAKYGADKMDSVDDINIFWSESFTNPIGPAAINHWFHISTGIVPMYINGNWVDVKALSDPETVEFIAPVGKVETAYTGHAEPVTLPRFINGVKNVTIKGGIYPGRVFEIYKALGEIGFGSNKQFKVTEELSMPLRTLLVKIVRATPYFAPEFFQMMKKEESEKYSNYAGGSKVVVKGTDQGKTVEFSYDSLTAEVSGSTALPAVIGINLMLEGKVKGPGVFPPEGAFDATEFLKKASPKIAIRATETREGNVVSVSDV